MNFIKWVMFVLGTMSIWVSLNVISTEQGWFKEPIAPANDNASFMAEAVKSIKKDSKGNGIFVLIHEGKVIDDFTYSKGDEVTRDTVFGVASLGKWVAAFGVMKLVEQGKLELDAPVANYLTRWQLPPSQFDNEQVTIRRLLSHTAGITDGLGHNGFLTAEQVQPLEQHLTKALDADEGVNGQVMVGVEPGTQFKYSGGSYNLLQLIVEEVSGMSFSAYMNNEIFEPLNMTNTGYDKDQFGSNLAQYFDDNGDVRDYPYYTSLAATGLYTSANDLIKFLNQHIAVPATEDSTQDLLSAATLRNMRTPNAATMGIDIWGLGVMLFASNNADDFIIGHGGQSPSLNATLRVNPSTGNGIIMLTTGNRSLAADTATKWTLWETGNPDIYMLKNMIPEMLKTTAIGCLVILFMSLLYIFMARRKARKLAIR
ncbi:serine hydrolase domain-containing protein [Shewanella sp. SG41-4]|uniref:serine hydrolase domain-containing protein n=1 Tax=Shewanella sp. SG41-4 TaxID=2760976 RepID=UPI001C72182C|nr:serine hydrolase domain-containing protein [Shewanella sp. SG41-4]